MYDMKMLKEELNAMMQADEGPCVSVYMPTHRRGPETQQDPIVLRNLLREAERELTKLGLRGPEVRQFLSQASELIDNNAFWRQQGDGLALFISGKSFKTYRLPLHFEQLLVVTDRFHFKPLIRLFNLGSRFYVLALGQRIVRLLQCGHYEVEEVDLGESVPRSLDEALKYDEPEAQLRFHTIAQGPSNRGVAMFHGQGVGIDESKTNIWRFFLQINEGVSRVLANETAPLVLSGLDHLVPIYREVNSYHHLFEKSVKKNPETLSIEELHMEARELVQPYFLKAREAAISKYGQLTGTNLASHDVEEIVPAAFFGRVDSLFVPLGKHVWGNFDPGNNTLELHEKPETGDADLLDLAAIQTFIQRGEVYVMEENDLPGESLVAALFRY